MANRVHIDSEGFLRQAYIGDQTEQMMIDTLARLNVMAGDLRAKGQKVYGLVDLSELGGFTPNARKVATDAVRDFPYDKAALYAPNSAFNKSLVNLILFAAGKNRQIKMFMTEKEAVTWLKGNS